MVYTSSAAPTVVRRFEARVVPCPDADQNVGTGTVTVGPIQYSVTMSDMGNDPNYGCPWTASDNWTPTNTANGSRLL